MSLELGLEDRRGVPAVGYWIGEVRGHRASPRQARGAVDKPLQIRPGGLPFRIAICPGGAGRGIRHPRRC